MTSRHPIPLRPVARVLRDVPWMPLVREIVRRPGAFVLDGGGADRATGGYSFAGSDPVSILRFSRQRPLGATHGSTRADPFERVRRRLARRRVQPAYTGDPAADRVPFRGGFVGFFGYDLGAFLERVPRRHPRASVPDLQLGEYPLVFSRSHASGEVVAHGWLAPGEHCDAFDRRVEARLAGASSPAWTGGFRTAGGPRSDFDRDAYLGAIERVREYILAGDVYQVNLSQRFTAPFEGDPFELFERLRSVDPVPFAAFVPFPGGAVASASPESFLRVSGRRVVTRPVKGTRPRGRDPAEDEFLARELAHSGKDRAELAMIVDLLRNDLGRVCEWGSVRVPRDRVLESHPSVHHLVSTVEGRLRADADRVDLLRATFPGGSITGAPKIRAMEIIDELERARRGLYTGSLGYLGYDGGMELNILIRSIVAARGELSFHVGGGIVADSDPCAEYEETLHKARGIFAALESARFVDVPVPVPR